MVRSGKENLGLAFAAAIVVDLAGASIADSMGRGEGEAGFTTLSLTPSAPSPLPAVDAAMADATPADGSLAGVSFARQGGTIYMDPAATREQREALRRLLSAPPFAEPGSPLLPVKSLPADVQP